MQPATRKQVQAHYKGWGWACLVRHNRNVWIKPLGDHIRQPHSKLGWELAGLLEDYAWDETTQTVKQVTKSQSHQLNLAIKCTLT